MSAATHLGRQVGSLLYQSAFPIYRPLYAAFKAYADRTERDLLKRYLTAGNIVVDAGANIGIYSQFVAKIVGATGQVHSFEPSPENFARLAEAVAGLTNVRCNEVALSDTSGESLLYLSDNLNVDHRAYPIAEESRATQIIRETSLDDYFAPGTRVDFIKMDIQGYELHALRGAERVLRDNPAVKLLLEFWPYGLRQAHATAEGLLAFLAKHGFSAYLPEKDRLTNYQPSTIDASNPEGYFNLFAERSS